MENEPEYTVIVKHHSRENEYHYVNEDPYQVIKQLKAENERLEKIIRRMRYDLNEINSKKHSDGRWYNTSYNMNQIK